MTATETLTGALARHRLQPGDVVAAIGDNSPAIWSLVEAASSLGSGARDLQRFLVGVLCGPLVWKARAAARRGLRPSYKPPERASHRLLGDGRSFAHRGGRRETEARPRSLRPAGFDGRRHRVLHVGLDRRSQMRRLDAAEPQILRHHDRQLSRAQRGPVHHQCAVAVLRLRFLSGPAGRQLWSHGRSRVLAADDGRAARPYPQAQARRAAADARACRHGCAGRRNRARPSPTSRW